MCLLCVMQLRSPVLGWELYYFSKEHFFLIDTDFILKSIDIVKMSENWKYLHWLKICTVLMRNLNHLRWSTAVKSQSFIIEFCFFFTLPQLNMCSCKKVVDFI